MADTRDDDRWDILVERYLEGRLFPSERAALRKRLAADPALRDRLVETVVQEAALRTIPLQEGAAAMEAGAAEIVRAAAARRLVRAAVWVAAAAAAVLLVAGAFIWLARPPAPAAGAPPLPDAALVPLRPADLFRNKSHWRTLGDVRFTVGRAPGRDGGVLNVDFPGPAQAAGDRVAWICSHATMDVQDWSDWDGIELGFLGGRSGLSVTVGVHDTGSNSPKRDIDEICDYTWSFADDFEGWRTLRVPWAAFRKEPGRGGLKPFAHVFGIGFELRRFVPGGGCRIGGAHLYKEKP